MNKYVFENGEKLDLSGFKGAWIHENIEKYFGSETAERIMNENPYYRMGVRLKEKYCNQDELK